MTLGFELRIGSRRPLYLAIVEALSGAIDRKLVNPGDRLPTHRMLAEELGVSVATVSKAYAEAEQRGQVESRVGRGTFVAMGTPAAEALSFRADRYNTRVIDLAVHRLPVPPFSKVVCDSLIRLGKRPRPERFLGMHLNAGDEGQRRSGAMWVARSGLNVTGEQVIVCNGGQHAILTALATLTNNEDVIVAEKLTDPSFKAVSMLLGRRLLGLAMDGEGVIPDAFEEACRQHNVSAIFCTPTLHNPTNAIMSVQRRQAIAEIARRHGVVILESDIFAPLMEKRPPPIATFAPERTFFISSLGKAVAPGIKVGYLCAPLHEVARLAAGIQLSTWVASPLCAELARLWIEDGTIDLFIEWHRRECRARFELAQKILGAPDTVARADSWHVWLPLPDPWRAEVFVQQAKLRGVALTPAQAFIVGRETIPHMVRVCLGTPSRKDIEVGCATVARLLQQGSGASYLQI